MERAELARLLGEWGRTVVADSGSRRVKDNAPYQIISEIDPGKFMAAFADAVAGEGDVFLCDPKWNEVERGALNAMLVGSDQTSALGARRATAETAGSEDGRDLRSSENGVGWLMIPTGGTAGTLRFARHDSGTISAALAGFTEHFGLARVNAVGVLPLHHVSGLMAWLRCVITGGNYLHADGKEIEAGRRTKPPEAKDGWVISLVPTQLERLLREPAAVAWLQNFRIIFLGGGPSWPELLERAAGLRLPLALGYGMTETAAMVTALRPGEFLAGSRSSGTALPHAQVAINAEGAITIASASLFRGYYPDWRAGDVFTTEDLGTIKAGGHLTVLGRRDGVIITGGEKVTPAEVEAVLRGTSEFSDVVVLGLPHAEWGMRVVAVYPEGGTPNLERVRAALAQQLARYKHPQAYLASSFWPRNAQGKINRSELRQRLG